VEDRTLSTASLDCAEFVYERWLTWENFQALKKLAGKLTNKRAKQQNFAGVVPSGHALSSQFRA
jgi:hypothetical protein